MADHKEKKKPLTLIERAMAGLKAFGKRKFKEFTEGRDTSTVEKVKAGAISVQELIKKGQKKAKKKEEK